MITNKPHIYFRADASSTIGYGHFVRTLALADMLGDGFTKSFVTRHPTQYQIEQIEAVCDNYISLSEEHLNEFLRVLHKDDIVVLDNYFFTTDYQREIKSKGCKLVCIDDMHDKHYVADVIINHGITDPSLFSVEPYTQLCLGLDWALLRKPFLEAKPLEIRENGHCVVSFGGVDWNNLTEKFAQWLSKEDKITKITAVVGDAYRGVKSLQDIEKVEVVKNLSAQQMADLFCAVEFAVLPTSTVCIEALACECPVYGGYYVDNQKEFYHVLSKINLLAKELGDINILSSFSLNTNGGNRNIRVKQTKEKYINIFKEL